MALAAATPRIYEVDSIYDQLPVKATVVIYQGAAIGMTGGYARGLIGTDLFAGFAMESVTGTAADGGVNVTVRKRGVIKLSGVGTAAVTDWGVGVYATADGTFTLTAASNPLVGKIVRWISTGVVMVAFNSAKTTL
jgi:hypothetical protein